MNVAPKRHQTAVNGIELAWYEWGTPGDPLILLAHATGLHARCWTSVVTRLPEFHVLALDLRGHGASGKAPPFEWRQFGADLTAFIAELDLTEIIGVGHSMGAHCIVQAALAAGWRFRRLTLFDPVIFPPSVYAAGVSFKEGNSSVARRRNTWDSPQQMYDSFKARKPFANWTPATLRDYCEYGLLRHGDGYRLACPPAIEAAIYPRAVEANLSVELQDIAVPVQVIRAEPRPPGAPVEDFMMSPTRPDLASQFPRGTDIYFPEYSHFMPMENPTLAASTIRNGHELENPRC